uniref:(California timema) hypothetical protein n=1 Tax=Timema californicum TaxID=61474 RepID=A0A7R9J799_TIMCA|nr:unnamed protein product [Timema californicum]
MEFGPAMPNDDRLKALLSDLGRATLRGVRKCPKCGTFNGTRGLSCKNKSCDVVFKEAGEKRKMSTEACKLVTGTGTQGPEVTPPTLSLQVFSVRVRDKGPDYRGFVQLPVVQMSGDHMDSEAALITHTSALCFVDTCQRSFDATILKCHSTTCHSQLSGRTLVQGGSTYRNSEQIIQSLSLERVPVSRLESVRADEASLTRSCAHWYNSTNLEPTQGVRGVNEGGGCDSEVLSSNGGETEIETAPLTHTGLRHVNLSWYSLGVFETCESEPEKSSSLTLTTCQHIQAALRCYAEATPLPLTYSTLTSLNISAEMKQVTTVDGARLVASGGVTQEYGREKERSLLTTDSQYCTSLASQMRLDRSLLLLQTVWQLATETTGPLVQRVSKNIMAVKCKASPKHPLGYLHFSFFVSRLKDRVENKFFCSCTAFKGQVKHATNKDDPNFKKCLHFYSCIAAFASDLKLSEEFAYYIDLEMLNMDPLLSVTSRSIRQISETLIASRATNLAHPVSAGDNTRTQLVAILSEDSQDPCEVEVEVLRDDADLLEATGITVSEDGTLEQVHGLGIIPDSLEVRIHEMDPETLNFSTVGESPVEVVSSKRKREEPSPAIRTQESAPTPTPAPAKKHPPAKKVGAVALVKKQEPLNESDVSVTFLQWLASVTERINQSMHFQFDGKPDPLVFHVPQVTISLCTHSKMGLFGPQMPLEITRSFVENQDGTYEPYNRHKDDNESFRKTESQPLIKPLELKTFLKVGNTAPDQVDPTPFLIEWIPDILPCSKIGELRIRFEFGHQRNGLIEKRQSSLRPITRTISRNAAEISITRITTAPRSETIKLCSFLS